MSHTLDGGTPLASRYGRLGGTSSVQTLPPGKLLSLILGFPHTGKTQLLESHPNAWIIRSDISSTSNPAPAAETWPPLNKDGQCLDDSGKPFSLSWTAIEEKIDILVELATKDLPRPETVVFDSLTSCLELLKLWAPENMFSSQKGKRWIDLDGKMSYSFIYDRFLDRVMTLKRAGYGVCIIGHLHYVEEKDSSGSVVSRRADLTITESFFTRIFPYCELICSTEKRKETATREIETPINLPGGKVVMQKKSKTIQVPAYYLGFEIEGLRSRYKGKAQPCIKLPPIGGWSAFTTAYEQELSEAYATSKETITNE